MWRVAFILYFVVMVIQCIVLVQFNSVLNSGNRVSKETISVLLSIRKQETVSLNHTSSSVPETPIPASPPRIVPPSVPKTEPVPSSEVFRDKTVYIRDNSNVNVLRTLKRGVFYLKADGGIGNQLLSFISSLLYAEILGVPFLYNDDSLNRILYILRPSNLSVLYVDVIPPTFTSIKNRSECWAYDEYRTRESRGYQSHIQYFHFKQETKRISEKPFSQFARNNGVFSMRGNCPLFKYWLSNREKCQQIRSMGYLSASADCAHPSDALFSEFVFQFFRRHFRFREAFVNSVNEVLKPMETALQVDRDKPFLPPFKKMKNLVSIHARFGGRLADFGDTFAFLDKAAPDRFYTCVMRKNSTERIVYVASDSSRAKRKLMGLLKDKYFDSNRRAVHSGMDWHRKKHTSGVGVMHDAAYTAFIDIIVSAMASEFIGTEASTFSSMIVMLGRMEAVYLYKNSKPCHAAELYLP